MSGPCRATKRIGCPDCRAVLVCHQPSQHGDLNHYDAQEQVWWLDVDGFEPVLYGEPVVPSEA